MHKTPSIAEHYGTHFATFRNNLSPSSTPSARYESRAKILEQFSLRRFYERRSRSCSFCFKFPEPGSIAIGNVRACRRCALLAVELATAIQAARGYDMGVNI